MPPLSALVDFLRTYGPVASSDSLCVENLWQTQKQFNVEPVETPAPRADDIRATLLGDAPRNVILTGTAGDGKTYHIRDFLLSSVPEAAANWPGDEDVLSFTLPSGRELRVIRDLSEISDTEKANELPSVCAALLGETPDRLYLVAANDGQLLKYFRDAAAHGGPEAERARRLHVRLSEMLRSETSVDDTLSLELMNLSRTWDEAVVDRIFDAVLEHPGWGEDCGSCPGLDGSNPCPIRLNRQLLRNIEGQPPSPFRQRIKQTLALAAANDQHVPVRQLLTLVVNIILGDSKNPNRPLMDCKTAHERARQGQYGFVNPYDNAVGLNLRPERRRTNRVFSVFEMLAVGHETNNLLDAVLVQNKPQTVFKALFDEEPTYGLNLFEPLRSEYFTIAGAAGVDGAKHQFALGLASQRRRAFFRLPDETLGEMASPWRLTIFHHGGAYLRLARALANHTDRDVIDRTTEQILRGMNRAYTGMMTSDKHRLWLSGTIGKTDEPSGRVATLDPIERVGSSTCSVRLDCDAVTRRPSLVVMPPRFGDQTPLSRLDLRPLLFEYLMRVANGSLPASFSRQCQQEIRHFSLVTQTWIDARLGKADDERQSVQLLSLGSRGELRGDPLEVY